MTKPRAVVTDEMAAYAAAAWASGVQQKEVAKQCGYGGPAPICSAIRAFLVKYHPEAACWPVRRYYGIEEIRVPQDGRKALIPAALDAFLQVRAANPSGPRRQWASVSQSNGP
jgi:hypothetical protein